jgi:hypothetical protein
MIAPTRRETRRAIELANDGVISWHDIAEMCLNWMSEDDVAEMLKANGFDFDEDEDEEDI